MPKGLGVLLVIVMFLLSSCAGLTAQQQRILTGGAIGAAGGAVLGAVAGSVAVGAAVGGLAGLAGGAIVHESMQ